MLRTIKTILVCSVACITSVTLGMFNKEGDNINVLRRSAPKRYHIFSGSTFQNMVIDSNTIEDLRKYVGLNSIIYAAYLTSGNYITAMYVHGGYNKNRYCCVYYMDHEEIGIDKGCYDFLKGMYEASDTRVNSFKKVRNKKPHVSAIFP